MKLDFKTVKCFFVGCGNPTGIKGYRLYNPITQRIFTSRDVTFFEDDLLHGRSTSFTSKTMVPDLADNFFYEVPDLSQEVQGQVPHA